MALFELLPWDTAILGLSIAKIIPPQLSASDLKEALSTLKSKGAQLVYWCADSSDTQSIQAAEQHQGFLADEKVTYLVDLQALNTPLPQPSWQCYAAPQASPALIDLALESGKYSRFLRDPRIGFERFKKVYTQWIHNACNHSQAKAVIIIERNGMLAAMATVGEKRDRGDIGLLAVSPDYQGQGLGTNLVFQCQAFFRQHHTRYAQVVTQKQNVPACKLYEKCQFKLESLHLFYHFWL